MELCEKHLVLTCVGLESAEVLLPAFNGDEQFNVWSNFPNNMSLEDVCQDIEETQQLPDGKVWRIDEIVGEHEHKDTLVGVAETAIHPNPETGWIALLIIRQPFQGRGFETEVVNLLEHYLYTHPHVRHIGLGVLVENLPAQRFWESRGYVRGERKLDSGGHDCYEYHK